MADPDTTRPAAGIDPEIAADHRRIRDASRHIRDAADLGQLLVHLAEFRAVLAVHFSREEADDGFYDMVKSMSPRLLGAVDRLEHEHALILAEVDRLSDLARQCLAGPVAEVLARARALGNRLRRHEAAEDRILLDTFYTDLGQGD